MLRPVAMLVSLASGLAFAQTAPQPAAAEPAPKPVDLAICLDTSGSMDGLIDAARQKLWDVVNDLATAKPRPALRVALLSFGNDGYTQESGWVKVLLPFSTDLDEVSNQLFALTTNGGTEYVGRVVSKATTDLGWSTDAGLKLIIVAGNESADQDQQVSYKKASADAIAKGIMVNSIYCGPEGGPDAPAWREVASLADGQFFAIDQNKNEVIPTPHDSKLAELSTALNGTYVPVGDAGVVAAENQARQDSNAAAAAPAAVASRAATKAGYLYRATWDLVDRVYAADEKERVAIETVKAEDLPENMRSMTIEQRREYVEQQRTRREQLRKEIGEVSGQRAAFLEEEKRKQATAAGAETFESALRRAVREQAASKGFRWEK
ncbi:MAG: vWA domain-containing protein [Phycisphaerales bacterium]